MLQESWDKNNFEIKNKWLGIVDEVQTRIIGLNKDIFIPEINSLTLNIS